MTSKYDRQNVQAELEKNRGESFRPLRASPAFLQAPKPGPSAVPWSTHLIAWHQVPTAEFTLTPTEPILLATHQISARGRDSKIVIGDSAAPWGRNEEETCFIHNLGNQVELPC